jgi:hypothetical protein
MMNVAKHVTVVGMILLSKRNTVTRAIYIAMYRKGKRETKEW